MGADLGRRRFLGYVLAAPTLVAAADIRPATDGVPSPQPAKLLDLNAVMTAAALPTAGLITIDVNADGTVSFALPRAEVGQGITTSTAMVIAEELSVPVERVRVTLATARPELVFNQLTGASNTTISTFTPIRVAAATARVRLLEAASEKLGTPVTELTLRAGVISDRAGRRIGIGSIAELAASPRTVQVPVTLTPPERFSVIGTPHNRVDARDAVTGGKKFTMDLQVDGAKPTMVCRAPTINGTVRSVANLAEVRAMPGVTDVVVISTGVAVRAETFGQCIDGVRALRVSWKPGTAEGKSDDTVLRELALAELPFGPRPLASTVERKFTFRFRGNSALETNCAIADVRPGRAEVWAALKSPIVARETLAAKLGLPVAAVTVHVVEGGGSFGRKLFFDAALEAAETSQRIGKPVKLMWHRADDVRQGRVHPMATSRVRIAHVGETVLGYEQRHTSVSTDLGHGFGEVVTALAARLPVVDLAFSEVFFVLSQTVPYEFGVVSQLLSEADRGFNTGSMRNVYSPDVTCARELVVDELAAKLRKDPYEFRRDALGDGRTRAALEAVAKAGDWGRPMESGTAQGIAVHEEYHSTSAALVEIDCRPATVNRPIRDGVAGPRVTKVVFAVDVGLTVNPRGLEAQVMGAVMDGIAQTLTSSLHLRDGCFLEASWDNYFYTRQWNTPPELEIIILPNTSDQPGGAGELGVAASMAAVACAYGRAVGAMPTEFPINHGTLSFVPKPAVPPVPASPVDGIGKAF
ncbi:molybdopterin cofactor-binding domain-containing protein [Amycolatopsis sp. NPDC098790]|uniref:molybdopterin cofactor-binding domain-containing protein n=1 Tax=Amycolatopsis sp. NPDC098790 TaxID=3363939 RepID=UPI003815A360